MEKVNRKGIDISYAQKGFDIEKAKGEGVEFVIMRAGIAKSTDTELLRHMEGVTRAHLPYGFYWYSRAFSPSEAREEARACIETIKKFSPIYPVFYDMEEKDQIEKLTKNERTEIILAFCEEIGAAGYIAGVYLNPSWLENYVEKDRILGKYELWLAHWTEDPNVPSRYDYGQIMWQWGVDRIDGQRVDGDICFKDFGSYDDPKPDPDPEPEKWLPVGDVVNFSGGKQYGASNSDIGYPARAGVVKISIRAKNSLHPYHVISEDESGVYGWVDKDTLSTRDDDRDHDHEFRAGRKIVLKDVELYAAAGENRAVRRISGTFYLYDGKDIDGYYRICPSEKNVNAVPVGQNVTGWVKRDSIILK